MKNNVKQKYSVLFVIVSYHYVKENIASRNGTHDLHKSLLSTSDKFSS